MRRDLGALTAARFDLLVVGGGIHGLFAAWDAARRGLAVALVERDDFGSGLSFNHQRTLHGGLRSLSTGNLGKVRQLVAERRAWALMAPSLIRPLPFLVGTYRWTSRSRLGLRVAFRVYDGIGRHRNAAVSPELHLPRARLESAAATRRLFPGIDEAGLSGGAVWYDYQTLHPERLTWTVALAAREAGATLVNHAEAIERLSDGGTVSGARVRDRLTEETADVQASVTLLAAGSGTGGLLDAFGLGGGPPLLRAVNLLIDRPAKDIAWVAPAPTGRMLTAVPWRGRVLVGTHQSADTVPAGETAPPASAIDECLAHANAAFPTLQATRADVRLVHHGLVPAGSRRGRVDLLADPRLLRHDREGTPGLVSLVGVKYTTARRAAASAIDVVCRALSRPTGRPSITALPHAGVADVEGRLLETLRARAIELDRDVVGHLTSWYGTEASAVVSHAADRGQLARLTPGMPVLEGELSYAACAADGHRLGDVVLRRTPVAADGHPGRACLERAATILAAEFGWSAERQRAEVAAVEHALAIPGA